MKLLWTLAMLFFVLSIPSFSGSAKADNDWACYTIAIGPCLVFGAVKQAGKMIEITYQVASEAIEELRDPYSERELRADRRRQSEARSWHQSKVSEDARKGFVERDRKVFEDKDARLKDYVKSLAEPAS